MAAVLAGPRGDTLRSGASGEFVLCPSAAQDGSAPAAAPGSCLAHQAPPPPPCPPPAPPPSGGVVSAEEMAPFLDPPRLPRRARGGPNKYEDEAFVLPALIRFGGEPFVGDNGSLLYRFPALQVGGRGRGLQLRGWWWGPGVAHAAATAAAAWVHRLTAGGDGIVWPLPRPQPTRRPRLACGAGASRRRRGIRRAGPSARAAGARLGIQRCKLRCATSVGRAPGMPPAPSPSAAPQLPFHWPPVCLSAGRATPGPLRPS